MVTADREDLAAPAGPDDIVGMGAPEGPILTLDLAQRIGLQTARDAVASAQAHLRDAEALLAEVFRSVGLNPDLEYPIDELGHVYAGAPRPNA
jgi:hypothetical protein